MNQGAESIITIEDGVVTKTRLPKDYRHPVLDVQLRKSRTRREAKVLEKIPVRAPKLIEMDDKDMILRMEHINGPQLRDALTQENAKHFAAQLGTMLKSMHDAGIIHADLTTSNILVENDKLVLIDFGLSFFSEHVEDKAVDLHLLKHTTAAKHPDIEFFSHVWDAYQPDKELMLRFEKVEGRGRYKQKQ